MFCTYAYPCEGKGKGKDTNMHLSLFSSLRVIAALILFYHRMHESAGTFIAVNARAIFRFLVINH